MAVEFQPSGWNKGSYLNVGAMWLWHPSDHWAFNEIERVAPFEEFADAAQFGEAATRLAESAAAEVTVLRKKFDSIHAVAKHLIRSAEGGFWQHYHAAFAAALTGDAATAKAHFRAVAAAPIHAPWVSEAQSNARCLSQSFDSVDHAREIVALDVARTREKLGLPLLPKDTNIWA